jgi:hypothetical protein
MAMISTYNKLKCKGSALVFVYIVIMLFAISSSALFTRVFSEKVSTESERSNIMALYAAEAGAAYALRWLKDQIPPPETTGLIHWDDNYIISEQPELNLPEQRAVVRVYAPDENRNTQFNRYIIFSLGSVIGPGGGVLASKQVVKEIQDESFAKYSYFSDDEYWLGIKVWFTTGSFLEGDVHTNTHYHISGDPVFDGPVSSHDDFIDYMYGGPPADNPEFRQGIELGIPRIEIENLNASRLKTAAAGSGGVLFEGDTTVKLLNDGTMNVTNAISGLNEENMPMPSNEALFVNDGDLFISGTLNGRMTAGSSSNIVILDNLTYKTSPVDNPASRDMMGLVSEGNIIISSSAPDDLSIYATMAATGVSDDSTGSFIVENWNRAPAKGTLFVYGGIIQIERGPVGTFNRHTHTRISGYEKDYRYDVRCRYNSPSWFPKKGDYEMLSFLHA